MTNTTSETEAKIPEEKPKNISHHDASLKAPLQNVILVGKKPAMNYALATIIQFNQGVKEITVKARGMAISKAVDIVEIVRRRFMEESVRVKDIKIGTEMLGEGENVRNVSTMEIVIAKI